ncbi:MAG: adenylate kinase family protein [Candidatus Hodarchaeota archaeon]
MKVIVLSGTPGTGKTKISKEIAKLINAKVITLNELAISENFVIKYDKQRDTSIIDEEKIISYLEKRIRSLNNEGLEFLIIESHFSDIVPDKYIDYAFILRCDPDILRERLKKRGYKKEKIVENIQSEILGNCVNYFMKKQIKNPLLEIDTTDLDLETEINVIIRIIAEEEDIENYYAGQIDWLEKIFKENRLSEFFD